MIIKKYKDLSKDSMAIRKTVFCDEQGFKDEFDEIDEKAIHIVCYEKEIPIATCRVYYNSTEEMYVVGRIAVIKEYRGKDYGAKILKSAEEEIVNMGGNKAALSAQIQAKGFYEKQGYETEGDSYMDEGCPHIKMKKNLKINN